MLKAQVQTRVNADTQGIGKPAFVPPLVFRLPPSGGVDPYFNLNRSAWNEKVLPTKANRFRPPIRSIVDRKPGNAKGRRMIVFASAESYFKKLAEQTESEIQQLAAINAEVV